MFVRRSLFVTLAIVLFASRALSQSIPVPDFDFSDPSAGTVGYATIPSTSAGLGAWQVPPPPAYWTGQGATAEQWYDGTGAFYNNPAGAYIDNTSGSQAGFMFTNPGLELSQTLSSTFQVGQSYQLTVGIGGGSGVQGPMQNGTPIDIGLYYLDGSGNQQFVGTSEITWSGTLSQGYVTHLTDYSVAIPAVMNGNAWAGKNIGVALFEPFTAPGDGSYWDVDNVRLTSPAPEPSTIALLAAGLGAVVLRRRWSSKKQTADIILGPPIDRRT
jgi:hypothetical protein